MTTVWRALFQCWTAIGRCGNETPLDALEATTKDIEKDRTMRKLGLTAALAAASVAVTGCATNPNQYGYDPYGNLNGYYNNGYNNGGYGNQRAGQRGDRCSRRRSRWRDRR